MKPNFKLLFVFVCTSISVQAQEGVWEIGYFAAQRGSYVFPGSSDTEITNGGLVSGKSFEDSAKASEFFPYGLEASYQSNGKAFTIGSRVSFMPTSIRLLETSDTQKGWNADVALSIGTPLQEADTLNLGGQLSFVYRNWTFESGNFSESSDNAGLTAGLLAQYRSWNAIVEAGVMAISLGNKEELGVQRDASTLRVRLAKEFGDHFIWKPWIEFFHSHRSFFGTEVLPGETAMFVDEAMLKLGVSLKL